MSETEKLLNGRGADHDHDHPPPGPPGSMGLQGPSSSSADDEKSSLLGLSLGLGGLQNYLPSQTKLNHDAVKFGARMSVCLTLSSLFVLVQPPGDDTHFPEGLWVLITVLFVCWFPTLDVASVLEKSLQRLAGTLIGASLALMCGFFSLRIASLYGVRAQAFCLACSFAIVTFGVSAAAVQTKIIQKKNYATLLLLLTFAICLVPFYSTSDDGSQWKKSMYRVKNVVIGCFLGVGLSMAVFPRPTVEIIQEKISRQIMLSGEASEAVLTTAADIFADNAYVPLALADEILAPSRDAHALRNSIRVRMQSVARPWRKKPHDDHNGGGNDEEASTPPLDLGHDVVLGKYEAAMKEWGGAKRQLGMLSYDPFNIGRPNDLLQRFRTEVAQTLARAMRIQTTVVLIDGIMRNDPKHKFEEKHLKLLAGVGTRIRRMLTVPLDVGASDAAAKQLGMDLVAMRRMIVELSAVVSSSPERQMPSSLLEGGGKREKSSDDDTVGMYGSLLAGNGNAEGNNGNGGGEPDEDWGGEGVPQHVRGSHVCSLLFLQLAEHLALRSVRLYQSWKQYEGVVTAAENMRASGYKKSEEVSDEELG